MFRYISGGGRYKVSCQNLIDKYSTERIASVGLASSKSRQYSKSCSNLLDKDWSDGQELGALKRSKSYSRITEEKSSYEQVLTLSQEIWTVLGIVFIPEEGKLSLHYKKYLHKYQRFLLTNRVSFIIFWQNFEGKFRHLEHLALGSVPCRPPVWADSVRLPPVCQVTGWTVALPTSPGISPSTPQWSPSDRWNSHQASWPTQILSPPTSDIPTNLSPLVLQAPVLLVRAGDNIHHLPHL